MISIISSVICKLQYFLFLSKLPKEALFSVFTVCLNKMGTNPFLEISENRLPSHWNRLIFQDILNKCIFRNCSGLFYPQLIASRHTLVKALKQNSLVEQFLHCKCKKISVRSAANFSDKYF